MFNNLSTPPLNDLPVQQPATPQQTPPSGESSADPRSKPPVMRQRSDTPDSSSGSSHGEGEPTDATRLEAKRWPHSSVPGSESCEIPPPSCHELNRPQTSALASPPQSVTETFSQQHHGALIALIQQHGGDVVASDGDTVQLTLPPATDLDFHVRYFCLKLSMLGKEPTFPGAESFSETMFDTFANHLKATALANQAPLVRQLLATGMANESGDLLRQLAERCRAGGAIAACDAITDTCAYWIDGLDPATLSRPIKSSVCVGDSDQPPPDWQSGARDTITRKETQKLRTALRDGDSNTVLDLLFTPAGRPACGQFFVGTGSGDLSTLIRAHGGIGLYDEKDLPSLVLYSTDLDRAALQKQLSEQQAADKQAKNRPENSSLVMAAQLGDADLFQALWSQATDAQRRRYAERSGFYFAADGATDSVLQLLPYADDPAAAAEQHMHVAAANGHTATCAMLLNYGATVHAMSLALEGAAANGHTETCAFLISRGARIDRPEAWVSSPLLEAVAGGHQKTCQLLVTAGARLNVQRFDDASVLSLAVASGNIGLYQFLLDHGAAKLVPVNRANLLADAARANDVPMLNYLFQPDDDLDRANAKGKTPLMSACEAGALDAVAWLLARGARVIPKGSDNHIAIVGAIERGNLPLLHLLMGAEVPAIYWMKALRLAISQEKPEMVRAIIPACPMDPLAAGMTKSNNPLLCVKYGAYKPNNHGPSQRYPILSALLSDKRLPLNHTNYDGNDALMLAVEARDATAAEMLVNAGLRIGQRSSDNKTALDYALKNLQSLIQGGYSYQNDEPVIFTNRILHTLSRTLLTQPDRFLLAQNAWRAQTDPTARDLALFLMFANSASTLDLPAMMAQDSVHTTAARDALMTLRADASPYALTQILMQLGVPSPLHDQLRPLLSTFPSIRDSLFSQGVPADRVLQAALDGLYLSRETEMVTLDAAAHYAPTLLDNDWKTTLTDMARQWLTYRIDLAAERQSTDIAPVFGDLFNRCAETLVTDDDYRSALQQQPEPGRVAAWLHEAGVYASLANEIDAAWRQAWQQVSNSVTATDRRSNDELGDALLAAFREALKKGVGEPSSAGNVITRIDAPAAAAQLYTDLMFQQLHMLQQFIHPETT